MTENKTVHILLVEDDDVDAEAVRRGFLKYKIANPLHRARDGMEALEMLRGDEPVVPQPNLVILDLNMPRMDGLGLVRSLREALKSTVPIIIVTTKGAEADRDQGLKLGANAYLTKPINGLQVSKTVSQFLG